MKIKPDKNSKVFLLILLLCAILLIGRLYKTGNAAGGDAVYYYSTLRSLAIDHDLDFKNEYQYFHNQTSAFTKNRKLPVIPSPDPITNKLPGKYPVGTALYLIIPFLITHFLINGDGYAISYQAVSAISSLIIVFIGLMLIYKTGKKLFDGKIAFQATVGIWLATPLIYYMTMEPLNSQSLSFFSVSLFFYIWLNLREKYNLKGWIFLGFAGGLMSMVRYQDGFFLLVPVFDNLIRKIRLRNIVLLLLSFSIAIIPQLLANNYLFGSFFTTGYQNDPGFPYLFTPKIIYSLFSSERGLLFWSPILILAFVGLFKFFKKDSRVGGLLIFSFLIQLYVVSSWADPSQGDSFGNRILLNCNFIFALGLMQFLKSYGNLQKIILPVFILLILLNALLAGLFVLRVIGQPY